MVLASNVLTVPTLVLGSQRMPRKFSQVKGLAYVPNSVPSPIGGLISAVVKG